MDKKAFRKWLKARHEDANPAADAVIVQRFLWRAEYKNAKCILFYLSIGYEVDTYQLIKQALSDGKRVCVPRCYENGIMDAVEIVSLNALKPGMYGILEPDATAPAIYPNDLDLILVPGMAFDRERNRLGRGAGYYDRYLEQTKRAATIGVCRSSRLFDAIPYEPHDRKVDVLITELEVIESTTC